MNLGSKLSDCRRAASSVALSGIAGQDCADGAGIVALGAIQLVALLQGKRFERVTFRQGV